MSKLKILKRNKKNVRELRKKRGTDRGVIPSPEKVAGETDKLMRGTDRQTKNKSKF